MRDPRVLQWQEHGLIAAVSSCGVEVCLGYVSAGQIVPGPPSSPQMEQWTDMRQNSYHVRVLGKD